MFPARGIGQSFIVIMATYISKDQVAACSGLHRDAMIRMHSAFRSRMDLDGGLSGSPGAEEDLGDPEEADRMQLLLPSFCSERYKYMQYISPK
jgi:hypothetical protein